MTGLTRPLPLVALPGLESPALLVVLAGLGTLALWGFGRVQRRAVAWIEARSAPRFRRRLTRYTSANLRRHLLLLWVLGLLLAVAAAGPHLPGEARLAQVEGRLVLLLDASISMGATDVAPAGGEMGAGEDGAPQEGIRRFNRAQEIARRLVAELDGHRFGLATFSGVATFQLPMTADRVLLEEAISLAELHTFQRNSGSDFTAALDAALHYATEGSHGLQVVLLSDGEAPRPEDGDYGDALAALEQARIPVHAVALGSEGGQGRVLWDLRTPEDARERLLEFTTRREERHLRRMARATGGWLTVDQPGVEQPLAEAIRERLRDGRAGDPAVEDEAARKDLAGLFLALFLVIFVAEALVFGHRERGGPAFEVERLGEGALPRAPDVGVGGVARVARPVERPGGRRNGAGRRGRRVDGEGASGGSRKRGRTSLVLLLVPLLSLLLSCGGGPDDRAHRENQRGIALDALGRHDAARPHYRRSIEHGVQPEVPTHNLARSRTLAGDWSEARDVYQQALELDPDLVPALYNDGVALWRWGEAELDPRGCQLDRTLELWQAAARRFATAEQRGGELQARALANRRHVEAAVAEVQALIADPPPECAPPPIPPPPAGNGGEGGGGDGDAGEGGGGGGGGGGEDTGEGGEGENGEGGDGGGEDGGGEGGEGDDGEGEDGEGEDERGNGDDGGEAGAAPQAPEPEAGRGPLGGDLVPLTAGEREEIRQALERLAGQRREEGKFFRRNRAEQFPRELWQDPDEEIWW